VATVENVRAMLCVASGPRVYYWGMGVYFTNDNFDSNNTPLQGEGSIRGGNEATNNAVRGKVERLIG